MKTKVAVLVDGEFFSRVLQKGLNLAARPTAGHVHKNALALANADEEVMRIFYYDSRPFQGSDQHPITRVTINYRDSPVAVARERFLAELGQKDLVALRCGETKPRGWQLTEDYTNRIKAGGLVPPPADQDYELRFEQKGVDMRIGIDVATLALNRHVDRIIVASNDTDLIPAFKVARRHGVQVVVCQIGRHRPHRDLIEDSDFRREVLPMP